MQNKKLEEFLNIHCLAGTMRTSEDRSGPLVTCTGNPCQSTGTSSPVSTGDLPVLLVHVTNGPDRSSEVLIEREFLSLLNKDIRGERGECINRLEVHGSSEGRIG